jgi:ribosomal protein S18 acetylase RimI-like enzyme
MERHIAVATQPVGSEFTFMAGAARAVPAARHLSREFGVVGAMKTIAKLSTPRRYLYMMFGDNSRIVSYGWGMLGRCSYYKIETDAVVVGPIWTSPEVRGRGLATAALQAAINSWIACGIHRFYIDTECDNYAAQKVFAKCGFGDPIALYIR